MVKTMFGCKCNCAYIAVIVGILFGFLFGILFGLGFLPFLPAIAIGFILGVAGIFFSPIYSLLASRSETCGCFCPYKTMLCIASVGTILSSFVAYVLFTSGVGLIAVSVVSGIAAFFAAVLITMLICLSRTVCCRG